MLRRSFLAAFVGTALLTSGRADAQACLGYAPFSAGRVRLGAGSEFGNGTRSFGAGLALGSASAFGGFGMSGVSYDNLAGSTFLVGAHAGYQIPVAAGGQVQVCPVIGGGVGFGPNNIEGSGVDASSRGVDVGLSVGASMLESAAFDVVPFSSLSLVYGSATLRADDGSSLTDSQTYGWASIGVGFVITRILTVTPSVSIPLGLEGADPTVGIGLSLHLGPRL